MRTIRRAAALLLAGLLLAGLCACGAASPLNQEAQFTALVKGYLDEIYRGRANDDYLTLTDSTAEDVAASYERGLAQEAVVFCGYFSVLEPSDQTVQEIKDLYRDIYASASYTVGKAVKADDAAYTVDVTVRPMNIMHAAIDDHNAALADFYREYDGVSREDLEGDELAAYDAAWARAVMTMVRGQLSHVTYLDAQTVSVRVTRLADGTWQMNEDDLQEIDRLILYYPPSD